MEEANQPPESRDKRLPKQFGDFAEMVVMYVLGQHKGMRVALVDHVGADIIATMPDGSARYAISVKGRNMPAAEHKGFPFSQHDADMLRDFAASFALVPAVAFVLADEMEAVQKIRLILVRLDSLDALASDDSCAYISAPARGGYHVNYGTSSRRNYLDEIKSNPAFDYTELSFGCLNDELNI